MKFIVGPFHCLSDSRYWVNRKGEGRRMQVWDFGAAQERELHYAGKKFEMVKYEYSRGMFFTYFVELFISYR